QISWHAYPSSTAIVLAPTRLRRRSAQGLSLAYVRLAQYGGSKVYAQPLVPACTLGSVPRGISVRPFLTGVTGVRRLLAAVSHSADGATRPGADVHRARSSRWVVDRGRAASRGIRRGQWTEQRSRSVRAVADVYSKTLVALRRTD